MPPVSGVEDHIRMNSSREQTPSHFKTEPIQSPNINPMPPELPQETNRIAQPQESQNEAATSLNTIPSPQPISDRFSDFNLIELSNLTSQTQPASVPINTEPPPYSQLYTVPLGQGRHALVADPPPPYDPSMRNPVFTIIPLDLDTPYLDTNRINQSGRRFECRPNTIIPCGLCYCTLEQLIVTIVLFGTFFFLGVWQMVVMQ